MSQDHRSAVGAVSTPVEAAPELDGRHREDRSADRATDHPVGAGRSSRAGIEVVAVGALMIIAHLAIRGWAEYRSWFLADDYALLLRARGRSLGPDYLLTPFNSHLMPAGRLAAWVVERSGSLDWNLAATSVLVVEAAAGAAALWMLITLFGRRWGVLGPLAIYLSTALTLPAFMWWVAALNQLPTQLGFFIAVGAWVRYLRGDGSRWAAISAVGVAIGVAFDVKGILVVPVLLFLALGWVERGSLRARVVGLVRRGPLVVATATGLLVAYAAFYAVHVDQPFLRPTWRLSTALAERMLGTSLVTASLGGPWRWTGASPTAQADPPPWVITVSWMVVAALVLVLMLRRTHTGRAWALLVGYAGVDYALVLTSRAPAFGADIGLELRFLTDVACVLLLCLGLATMPVAGAPGSSQTRTTPVLTWRPDRRVLVGLVVAVTLGGLVSQVLYATHFHRANVSHTFMTNLDESLRTHGRVDLADAPVSNAVVPTLNAPDNELSRLVPLLAGRPEFPATTDSLTVVTDDGLLHQAVIGPGVVSQPGADPGCGWRVESAGRDIPLTSTAFPFTWWVRVAYLSSADATVTVSAGDSSHVGTIHRGLGQLFVHVRGTFDQVSVTGLPEGATMCIDTVQVGPAEAGALL